MATDHDRSAALEVVVVEVDESTVSVALAGEADLASVPALEGATAALVDAGVRRFVFDCAQLTFLDSSGLTVLATLHARLKPDGGSIVLRNPTQIVEQVISATGMQTLIEIA